jgi:hypothetical protein
VEVTYDIGVARALSDPLPAIYLAALCACERERGTVIYLAPAEVGHATALAPRQVHAARAALAAEGFVELVGHDGRRTGHRIRHDVIKAKLALHELTEGARERTLDARGAPKVEAPRQLEAAGLLSAIAIADVRAGRFDTMTPAKLAKCEPLHEALLAHHATVWGKDPRSVHLTPQRKQAFAAGFTEGRSPSDFVRAIEGMVEDDWPKRPAHTEIKHVVGQFEKWVGLAHDVDAGRIVSRRGLRDTGTVTIKDRRGREHIMPAGHEWTTADENGAAEGRRFDHETRTWKRPHA